MAADPTFLPVSPEGTESERSPFNTMGAGVQVAGPGKIGLRALFKSLGKATSTRDSLIDARKKARPPSLQRAEPPPKSQPMPDGNKPGGKPPGAEESPFAKERDPDAELLRRKMEDAQDRKEGQPVTAEETARHFQTTDFDDLDLDQSWQTNFDVIDEEAEVKNVIGQIAEMQQGKIDEARRGTITDENMKALAMELNVDRDVVRKIMVRETGDVVNAETILSARMVLHRSANRLAGLAKKIVEDPANVAPIERVQFMRQMYFHRAYQTQFMGARAETGRALRAFGFNIGAEGLDAKRIEELVTSLNGDSFKSIDRLAGLVNATEEIQELGGLTRSMGRRIESVIADLFIPSILSGVKTQLVNAMGSPLFMGMETIERKLAAYVGHVFGDKTAIMEVNAEIFGAMHSLTSASKLAGRSFMSGEALDQAQKIEYIPGISSGNFGLNPASTLGMVADGTGAFLRAPLERVMGPIDEFNKTIAFNAKLGAQAYRRAAEEGIAENLPEAEISRRITEYMNKPLDDEVKAAEEHARHITFQTPVGPKMQAIERAISIIPGGRIIVPFIKTPSNLFKQAFAERSPLGMLTQKFWADASGKNGHAAQRLVAARQGMSLATITAVWNMAISGAITGGGPKEYVGKQALQQSGIQPYSFKVEDKDGNARYYSYQRSEPLSFIIGTVANMADIYKYQYQDPYFLKTSEERISEAIGGATIALMQNMQDKTFLRSLDEFFGAAFEGRPDKLSNYLENTAKAFIPYSALRRDIRKIADPAMRQAWTLSDKIALDMGLGGDLPAVRDLINGDPMEYEGVVINPWPVKDRTSTALQEELNDVLLQTGKSPLTYPQRYIHVSDVDSVDLNVHQYDRMVEISRKTRHPGYGGRRLRQALEHVVFKSASYRDADPIGRLDMVRSVVAGYHSLARCQLAGVGAGCQARGEDSALASRVALNRQKAAEAKGQAPNPSRERRLRQQAGLFVQ